MTSNLPLLEIVPDETLMIQEIDGSQYFGAYHEVYYNFDPDTTFRVFEPIFKLSKNFTVEKLTDFLIQFKVEED